jgi:hypothetical protein
MKMQMLVLTGNFVSLSRQRADSGRDQGMSAMQECQLEGLSRISKVRVQVASSRRGRILRVG